MSEPVTVVGAVGVASDCFFLCAIDNNDVAIKKDRRIIFMLEFLTPKAKESQRSFQEEGGQAEKNKKE